MQLSQGCVNSPEGKVESVINRWLGRRFLPQQKVWALGLQFMSNFPAWWLEIPFCVCWLQLGAQSGSGSEVNSEITLP